MTKAAGAIPLEIGTFTPAELRTALDSAGVALNAYAEAFLDHPAVGSSGLQHLWLNRHTPEELGLPAGGSLSTIYRAALTAGLRLCPPETAAYLRLVTLDQEDAPDSVLSNGTAPSGSLTIASAPLEIDDEFPKGLYLRVIDGVAWLRGYRCDDEHVFSPQDRFVFCSA